MLDAYLLFAVLGITLGLFIWGYWRFDIVAALSLISLTAMGIIPFDKTFTGFANPAVITVACVMIITAAITQSGIVDSAVSRLEPFNKNITLQIFTLMIITAILSAFMNNVGALALMMPVAIKASLNSKRPPALVLMPLAFGSVLGGMCTAIGTPPNLLISAYRQQLTGHAYAMFDFSPVGLVVAGMSLIFIALIGWRLLPHHRKPGKRPEDLFQVQDYISEIIIPEDSAMVGKTREDLEDSIEGPVNLVGLIRGKKKRLVVPGDEILQSKDILIIEASHDDLHSLIQTNGLELVGGEIVSRETLRSEDIGLTEAVVAPGSRLEGRSWQRMRVRSRYRINLLAIARSGKPFKQRLNYVNLRAGDVVLLQGNIDNLEDFVHNAGLLPLVQRGVKIGMRHKAIIPIGIFALAILLAALQIVPVQIGFAATVVALVILNIMPARQIYSSIDWSVIVLLAAMIPIGGALQTSGATDLIATTFVHLAGHASPIILIGSLLLITMTLSDLMNNAATAVVMAPIAASIAHSLNLSVDPFLMSVAVGASCSFLTPISHQNNTLVMGPGGYKFQDYIRLGLPVEIIVLLASVPMILTIWPMK